MNLRRLVTLGLLAVLILMPDLGYAWTKPTVDNLPDEAVKTARYVGETDLDMLNSIRGDLESATGKDSKVKVYRLYITSPGGSVVTSLDIARRLREASDKGLVVEVHAEALCASGCTWVLAAGTPGHRYISKWALFLVHGPQSRSECKAYVEKPKTEDEKITNAILYWGRDMYVWLTKKAPAEVEDWLSCGQERVGLGNLAVTMGLADKVE